MRRVKQARRGCRYAIVFLVHWFFAFQAGYSRVQEQWRYLNTTGYQAREQFRREGATSRWHLRATGLRCIHRLVVAKRPLFFDITVANGKAMLVEVGVKRTRQAKTGNPEAARRLIGGIGSMQRCACSGGECKRFAGMDVVKWAGRFLLLMLIGAHLYRPEVRWQVRREMQLKVCAIGAYSGQRGVQCSAGIDDQHIAWLQKVSDAAKVRMPNLVR